MGSIWSLVRFVSPNMWDRLWTPSKWGSKSTSMTSHCMDWSKAPLSAKTQGPTNVGLHFVQRDHSASDILNNLLEFIKCEPKSPDTLAWHESREKFWMHRLKSLKPFGINATNGYNHIRSRHNRSLKDQLHDPQTWSTMSTSNKYRVGQTYSSQFINFSYKMCVQIPRSF